MLKSIFPGSKYSNMKNETLSHPPGMRLKQHMRIYNLIPQRFIFTLKFPLGMLQLAPSTHFKHWHTTTIWFSAQCFILVLNCYIFSTNQVHVVSLNVHISRNSFISFIKTTSSSARLGLPLILCLFLCVKLLWEASAMRRPHVRCYSLGYTFFFLCLTAKLFFPSAVVDYKSHAVFFVEIRMYILKSIIKRVKSTCVSCFITLSENTRVSFRSTSQNGN